ncbi:hypothetical protein GCM10010106_02720 [Thermopolyspora flexuosa]|uniref:DUF779 domain-containing protein n=1 Tax=Thermopolyspora flexuosa TaxID=103836 RepID=A0A543IYB3_9ACTN|nr:DUF779 domain-containing protein [Thermopolyspora flexuosa]PZN46635.1 MAG: DUF779 domain-containing protein [Actinomycetota bacterium]TQM75569.1 hypothetical protein FHX40_2281 [Thermopolyspora flexuosa]GGM60412.1 hypothetical protein GCM10010106_02720 [Thermopolyspora flexuosa]
MTAPERAGAEPAPAGAAGAGGEAPGGRVERVRLTPEAERLLARLIERHGPVMFHQSGGCCDGSAPMCYPRGEFRVGASDVLLGTVAHDTPFWISADQYRYWSHTHLTVDVVPGRGSGFSLEAPEGVRFLLRSRLFTDEEAARIAAEPPLPTGAGL